MTFRNRSQRPVRWTAVYLFAFFHFSVDACRVSVFNNGQQWSAAMVAKSFAYGAVRVGPQQVHIDQIKSQFHLPLADPLLHIDRDRRTFRSRKGTLSSLYSSLVRVSYSIIPFSGRTTLKYECISFHESAMLLVICLSLAKSFQCVIGYSSNVCNLSRKAFDKASLSELSDSCEKIDYRI